jgi:hypothetical protein
MVIHSKEMKNLLMYQKKTVILCNIIFLVSLEIVIFESVRLKIADMLLRKKSVNVKRQKMLHDFASAKYIGVLCSPQDEMSTEQLKDFLFYLSQKGIRYSVFGYFDGEDIPENFLYWKGMDFITRKDLSFFFIPKNPMVDKFVLEPFDMLINCSLTAYFPMEYIVQLSVAKCKVGIMRKGETCYDLMFDIQKNHTIEYFLNNLDKYLSNIRYPQ